MWTEVGLLNGTKVKVINFVCINDSGPRNGGVPEAVVVQFWSLAGEDYVQQFLDGYPRSVAIPMKQVEWKHNGKNLIGTQFSLMLSWTIKIRMSQGHTSELAVIDLGTSEKCCGMSLVVLSFVKKLNNIFLKPFSY